MAVEVDPDLEHTLPEEFLLVETPPPVVKILSKDIMDALKGGRQIPGCAHLLRNLAPLLSGGPDP